MTTQGRSLDDLPLAAYTTGMQPDARLEPDVAAEPAASVAAPTTTEPPEPTPGGDPFAFDHIEPKQDLTAAAAALGRRAVPAIPVWLAHPRQHLREPRLLMTGVIAVGVALLGISLLTGGGSPLGAAAAKASPTAPTVDATIPPPVGAATVEVTGKLAATYELNGMTGVGPASKSGLAASWGDSLGSTLGLSGPAVAGTRTTGADFVLTWTAMVNGKLVTFTSEAGECTVGMAVKPDSVTGNFFCTKLKSSDGKLTLDASGTYRT